MTLARMNRVCASTVESVRVGCWGQAVRESQPGLREIPSCRRS